MSALLESLLPSESRAECAKNDRQPKQGAAADRAQVAQEARQQRNLFPTVQEHWARSDWMNLVRHSMHNKLARLTAARRVPAMVAAGNVDARTIVAQPRITPWPPFPGEREAFYERCDATSESRKSEHCRTFGRAAADRVSNLERQTELGRALGAQS